MMNGHPGLSGAKREKGQFINSAHIYSSQQLKIEI
jgi:hypothetical protein